VHQGLAPHACDLASVHPYGASFIERTSDVPMGVPALMGERVLEDLIAGGLRPATRGTSAGYAESSTHSDLVGRLKTIEGASLGVALRHSPAATRPCQR
jgi:hypothetical protein